MNKIQPNYSAFLKVMTRGSQEFVKLKENDRSYLALALNRTPEFLKTRVDNIVSRYGKENVNIDGEQLFNDVMSVWWSDTIAEPEKIKSEFQ